MIFLKLKQVKKNLGAIIQNDGEIERVVIIEFKLGNQSEAMRWVLFVIKKYTKA